MISCNKDINEPVKNNPYFDESEVTVSDGEEFTETELGDQLNNPFHIDTMQRALDSLLINFGNQLEATHKYIRFLPETIWQYMALLDDSTMDLYDYPFDREIELLGDYYQEPNFDLEDFTWLYTVVPYDKELPDSIENEELCDLYLPEDSILTFGDTSILADDLIEEAFNIAGYSTEYSMKKAKLKTTAVKYYPEGYIYVQNTELGNDKPIKNVKVKCRYWFNLTHTYSNSSGHFKIFNGYKGKVTINLEFKNSHCAIRGFRENRVWEIADAVDVPVGVFTDNAMQNVQFTLWNTTYLTTEKKRRWMSANACNSVEEYRNYANSAGIYTPPSNLNIWLTTKYLPNSSGSACLLKQIGNTSLLLDVIDMWLWYNANTADNVFILFKRIAAQYLPDVTCGYNGYFSNYSDIVTKLFYHELAHTSHYRNAGNNFWVGYINYIIANNGYGTPSTNGVAKVELSEGWAEFNACYFTHNKYGSSNNALPWKGYTTWLAYIEDFDPRPGHFPDDMGGLMLDLIDELEPAHSITDEVDEYTISEIFNALQSNIDSPSGFHTLLLSQNSNKQQTEVDDLFSDYGF